MLVKSGHGQTIYFMQGTPGAVSDERVWERLLAGETVLVMEPDALKFTIFADDLPMHVFTITGFEDENIRDDNARLMDALNTVRMSDKRLNNRKLWTQHDREMWATVAMVDPETKKVIPVNFVIRPGEPKYLSISQEQIQRHRLAGRDTAEKIAAHYREIIKVSMNAAQIDAELERHGTTREGRD